ISPHLIKRHRHFVRKTRRCTFPYQKLRVPANSALKLTVRRRFSRRPSRLPYLEFARRRATCTGIIGCAASGAPLDAGRPPAARNLTSRRWADEGGDGWQQFINCWLSVAARLYLEFRAILCLRGRRANTGATHLSRGMAQDRPPNHFCR